MTEISDLKSHFSYSYTKYRIDHDGSKFPKNDKISQSDHMSKNIKIMLIPQVEYTESDFFILFLYLCT